VVLARIPLFQSTHDTPSATRFVFLELKTHALTNFKFRVRYESFESKRGFVTKNSNRRKRVKNSLHYLSSQHSAACLLHMHPPIWRTKSMGCWILIHGQQEVRMETWFLVGVLKFEMERKSLVACKIKGLKPKSGCVLLLLFRPRESKREWVFIFLIYWEMKNGWRLGSSLGLK
jgi:hypothetical protein